MKKTFTNPKILRKLGGICFLLMWIPFGFLMIGLLQLPTSVSKVSAPENVSVFIEYALLPLLVLFALSFLFIILSFVVSGYQKWQIRKHGKPGVAKILQLYETGSTVNKNPLVGFKLEVYPDSGALFKTETEQLISRLALPSFQKGMKVNIIYHPKTRQVLIV